ncbi:metallophosphoesterase family protein [Mycolicibacterium frederiksbergense]|uniref:Metallophosphoesterase n=1 Tax=Mycolicibacterium frederiksbergense TaxID=117567 RepID=A0A6H0RX03_9MYCO|nr:metallophosphoesterase [Mycolicibacterium frederiksbergense]QIV79648.1 metallophosphoesterase [Mycolicibacterium frederiksbergense]
MKELEREFKLWAFGDAHVGTDIEYGRESLADAIRQSEYGGAEGGQPFDWDIAIDAGDMSGTHLGLPSDAEGAEIRRQFSAMRKHRREDVYSVSGNHDRSGLTEPAGWWWQKWIDPLGRHTEDSGVDPAARTYPVQGTWERYSFRVGNILFLMMSDINEPTQAAGRGELGGNPGGVVSGSTFEWWKRNVEENPESIIVTVHHYVLKGTTVASGEWEGVRIDDDGTLHEHYHRPFQRGTPNGASYLYWVDSKPDSGAFESYLEAHPGSVALWIAGHTHTNPDDSYGGKTHIEQCYGGTYFMNAASLSKHHMPITTLPISRLLTFTPGSSEVQAQCYLHTSDYAPQGWYEKAYKTLNLNKPFSW